MLENFKKCDKMLDNVRNCYKTSADAQQRIRHRQSSLVKICDEDEHEDGHPSDL